MCYDNVIYRQSGHVWVWTGGFIDFFATVTTFRSFLLGTDWKNNFGHVADCSYLCILFSAHTMKSVYNIFRQSVKEITKYYMLLVEETRSERLVGSTNEWVLDNYYMISEQEKVLKNELRGVEKGKWRVDGKRVEMLWDLLEGYLKKCHHQIDKALFFRYLAQVQQRQKDYLAYPEVTALLRPSPCFMAVWMVFFRRSSGKLLPFSLLPTVWLSLMAIRSITTSMSWFLYLSTFMSLVTSITSPSTRTCR